MKNKLHKYLLKAFLESRIPIVVRRHSPNLMIIDSIIGGYCTQLICGNKKINIISTPLISKEDKTCFSKLINQSSGLEKEELVEYYRLIILVESIIVQYRQG